MEKHIDFDYELKEQVIQCVKQISNSQVVTKLNSTRENNIAFFRLTVIGKKSEVDTFLAEFNSLLILK